MTIPFAVDLAQHYPAEQVRSRRDFKQLVTLIQASAILHQRQRQRDEAGRIIATEADYRAIHATGRAGFTAVAAEGVTPAVRETVAKVAELTNGAGGRATIGGETVSVQELAVALNLGPVRRQPAGQEGARRRLSGQRRAERRQAVQAARGRSAPREARGPACT